MPDARPPELRRDPFSGRWVVVAADRARRPSDFRRPRPPPSGALCPFCPGNEHLTPPEVWAAREAGHPRDGAGWRVRVVPNKYPALRVEGELDRTAEGLYDRMHGVGAHEVLVAGPGHDRSFGALSDAELAELFGAISERMRDLAGDPRLRLVVPFVNEGADAGATLEHPHAQLIALPYVPDLLATELRAGADHHARHERCLFCDVIRQEHRDRVRIVFENEACVVLTPFASRAPFEQWILPRRHASHFEDEPRSVLGAVAHAFGEAVRRLDVALERPAWNLVLHSGPARERALPHFHWHMELVPALQRAGGFELSTASAINPVPPEEAATFLRRAGEGR